MFVIRPTNKPTHTCTSPTTNTSFRTPKSVTTLQTHTQTRTHTCAHTCTHTYTHMHTHMHTHFHTRTRTRTQTQASTRDPSLLPPPPSTAKPKPSPSTPTICCRAAGPCKPGRTRSGPTQGSDAAGADGVTRTVPVERCGIATHGCRCCLTLMGCGLGTEGWGWGWGDGGYRGRRRVMERQGNGREGGECGQDGIGVCVCVNTFTSVSRVTACQDTWVYSTKTHHPLSPHQAHSRTHTGAHQPSVVGTDH